MTSRRDFLKTGAVAAGAGLVAATPLAAQAPAAAPAPAAPKAWQRPQRAGPPVSIDIHTHWAPEPYLKAKAALGQPDFLDPINHDLDRRRAWMDTHGVKTLVLTLGGFRPWVWVTPVQGANIARVTNDAAAEAHKAYPDRFVAGIEVNCSDPAGALAELNRMAGKPGFVCLHLPTSLAGRDFMFEPAWQPIFARANDMALPILLHPLDGKANYFGGMRLADVASGADPNASEMVARFPGLTNSLGNSLEMTVCMAKLITSGTLDRYPNIPFIATGGGGGFLSSAGRLEGRGGARLKRPLKEYMRQFHYDSLVFWPELLRDLVAVVGADRVVLGTDNMFGPGNQMSEQPHTVIDQAGFTAAERDLILRGNLKRLFKI